MLESVKPHHGGRVRRGALLSGMVVAVLAVGGASAQQSGDSRERSITTSDGVRLWVKVAGSGPPVLVVHGGPGQGTLSFERMGGSSLEAFATMIYLDQRGSGRSGGGSDYHLERVLRDIDEVRAQLGYEKVYLLAHSFGGVLAVNYAASRPQHVAGVIMVAATVHFLSDALLTEQIAFIDQLLGRPMRSSQSAGREALWAAWDSARSALNQAGLGYRLLTDSVASIATMNTIDGSYQRAREFGRAVIQQRREYPEYYRDYSPRTREVSAPVLVIAGTRDHAIGPTEYRTFQFPRPQVVTLDAGHLLYYENTRELASAVDQFLKGSAR